MEALSIITPSAGMFHAADRASGRETDALFGETVSVVSRQGGWAEVILATDGYRAWIAEDALGVLSAPSHHITAPRALITVAPDIKSPAAGYLPMGSLITAYKADNRMMMVTGINDQEMGYMMADHAMPIGQFVDDYVAAAERMIGIPYRWGGRDSFGIDCSALVQLSLAASGVTVPRNSGDQEHAIGRNVGGLDELQRGDLVFWKGHVGIMQDADTLLHANMWHGMTATENLRAALPRLEKAAGPITRLARI